MKETTTNPRIFIDCPLSTDVVFRKGSSWLVHRGNADFRDLIVRQYDEYSLATSSEKKDAITRQIVDQVTETGRFLEWDTIRGCWTPMADSSQIHVKVALTLRDFKKHLEARRRMQNAVSSTYQYVSHDGRKRRRTEEGKDKESPCALFCSSEE